MTLRDLIKALKKDDSGSGTRMYYAYHREHDIDVELGVDRLEQKVGGPKYSAYIENSNGCMIVTNKHDDHTSALRELEILVDGVDDFFGLESRQNLKSNGK